LSSCLGPRAKGSSTPSHRSPAAPPPRRQNRVANGRPAPSIAAPTAGDIVVAAPISQPEVFLQELVGLGYVRDRRVEMFYLHRVLSFITGAVVPTQASDLLAPCPRHGQNQLRHLFGLIQLNEVLSTRDKE